MSREATAVTRPIAGWVVVLGLLAALGWTSAGWSFAVLVSASMEPAASPGDLLVHRDVPATQIAVGDIVTVPMHDDRLGTSRVVRLAVSDDGSVTARLQGDANPLPDPAPVPLHGEVARVVAVVPRVGTVLTTGAPLLGGGVGLLVLGGGALLVARRDRSHTRAATGTTTGTSDPAESRRAVARRAHGRRAEGRRAEGRRAARRRPSPDPRLEALLAACEQFAADDMPVVVLRDLVRVRTADLLGLRSAERAGVVLSLDDAARFYVIGLADADPEALALVPTDSDRRLRATAALDQWWLVVGRDVPPHVADQLTPWLVRRAQ